MESQTVRDLLQKYDSPQMGKKFFQELGYKVMEPLPIDLSDFPEKVKELISSIYKIVDLQDSSSFSVYHVQLRDNEIKRTHVRRFLETFYRHYSQGENLFVFCADNCFDELHFVSPRRLLDPRDQSKVRLWLRTLPVRRSSPSHKTISRVTLKTKEEENLCPSI